MSKSRSCDDKDKEKEKEKEHDREKERDKDNREEEDEPTEENVDGAQQQRPVGQLRLTTETDSSDMVISPNSNSLMVRNETTIPSSPPPSYEHVLEQTLLEHEAGTQKQDGAGVMEKDQQLSWTKKNASGNGLGSKQKEPQKGPEILHKSSKEFYRAMAKQWGITCKMSDHCRCVDCQSHYFDCEYDKNENQKTDGGLGAGTPMFISEVMHGSGCVLL